MILLITSIIFGLYFIYKLTLYILNSNNDFWPNKGVPLALSSEIASYIEILTGKVPLHDVDLYYYNKFKAQDAPFVGVMEMRSPVIQVRDLELIKRIYIKDFEYFVNRRSFNFGDKTLDENFLFNMANQPWKDLRNLMTPTFTTGKIRRMFQHFDKSGQNIIEYVKIQNKKEGQESGINLRELFGRFTMDVISSTAFGMKSECLLDDESIFMKMGRRFQNFNSFRTMKLFCVVFIPWLSKFFKLSIFDAEAMKFFQGLVKRNMVERQKLGNNGDQYHDFLQLMMESRNPNQDQNKGKNEDLTEGLDETFEKDAQLKHTTTPSVKIDDGAILANSLTFFLAGFDTTESLMSFITYHLAIHPEMQERLRDEIIQCTEDTQGKITYDAMNKMRYLDMFVSEILRLYPPATRTERRVTKPYQIPGTDVILPAETVVAIPILGIHRDEKHYPEPEKFDPERFSPENKAQRNPYAFMPFGHGPRNCIGMRFALFETKAAIAHLVKNFEITPCAATAIPLKMENISGNLKPAKDLKVAFKLLLDQAEE